MIMQTLQIRLMQKQITALDKLCEKGIYPNKSEAVRDAVRKLIEASV